MSNAFTNPFSEEVWSTTYRDYKDANFEHTLIRVGNAIASVEKDETVRAECEKDFFDMLNNFKVTAGGRIYSNAGTEWAGTTLMNCYVGPRPKHDIDSLDGIIETLRQQAQTLKSEGGWGMNFSFIRPRGSFINGIGVESPGSVKYAELFDKSSDVITSGSGLATKNVKAKKKIRKGAMMAVLDVWHPDIEEFITAKQTAGRLTKFNMSSNCSNRFMDRVIKIVELENLISKKSEGVDNTDTAEVAKLTAEIQPFIDERDALDKWDLMFPNTTIGAYKKEWNGNIEEWLSNGHSVKVHKTISAIGLWKLIMDSTYNRNEPGVLFLDVANKTHCWNYGKDSFIAATNPCGEQCLPYGAVCNLASINLTQFIDIQRGKFDFENLEKYVRIAVRFLDNVNEYTNAPLPEYLESIRRRRRIGLGVMGWASSLLMLKIRFASDAAEKLKEKLMKTIVYTAVEASIDLAVEKGMFPDCEPEKHAAAEFWKQINLPAELLERMKRFGIRNSALFSIQPTGNTSIFANLVSGGLEPVFLFQYIRTSIVNHAPQELIDASLLPKYWEGEFFETDMFKFVKEGDETILRGECPFTKTIYKIDKNRGLTKETLCEDYGVRVLKELGEWNEKADWAVNTESLTTEEHIRDMVGWAKWIDSSMSKTINLPHDYPFEKFQNVYLNGYKSGVLKGITTYRAGTMTTVLAAAIESKPDDKLIKKTHAPKRSQAMDGEMHHITIKGHRYYVAVGMLGTEPYEVFTGSNHNTDGEIIIPKSVKEGKIVKHQRGKYGFVVGDEEYHLTNGHNDDSVDALTRIISTALRHGSDISIIVQQLQKTRGEMMSFGKVLSRTLKKYIQDGTTVTGEECPNCTGGKMIFKEGCSCCNSCGYSKCS